MATELAVAEKRETRLAHPLEFSSEQVRILTETVAKGCDQNELAFFLNVCKLKRLDPFTGQVHCVKRWDSAIGREKMSIQVGIDGFRVIAVRSNELAGITEPEFDTEDEQYPNWARVTVYRYGRDNEKIPYAAKARYSEYVQTKKDGTPNHMWATKPYIMLGKCAEALALRKAFPDELSGMYSDEEMEQADNEQKAAKPPVQQPKRASEKQQPAQQQATDNGTLNISGVIESLKEGKEGAIWITLDKKLVVIESKYVHDTMKVGSPLAVKAQKRESKKIEGGFYAVLAILADPPIAQAEPTAQAEPVQELESKTEGTSGELKALFDNGSVKKASEVLPPKTIGKGRAQRLYAIMTQNAKTTGLTEEILKEKILSKLPKPLEHLSDLDFGMKDQFEKIMTGEIDWRDIAGE